MQISDIYETSFSELYSNYKKVSNNLTRICKELDDIFNLNGIGYKIDFINMLIDCIMKVPPEYEDLKNKIRDLEKELKYMRENIFT